MPIVVLYNLLMCALLHLAYFAQYFIWVIHACWMYSGPLCDNISSHDYTIVVFICSAGDGSSYSFQFGDVVHSTADTLEHVFGWT